MPLLLLLSLAWIDPPGCSATLVGEGRLLLTAAHCVIAERLAPSRVPIDPSAWLQVAFPPGFVRSYSWLSSAKITIADRTVESLGVPRVPEAYLEGLKGDEPLPESENVHDLALLELRREVEGVAPQSVRGAAAIGDRVTHKSGETRIVDHRNGLWVLRGGQLPVPGDSGGPLWNEAGKLVGVIKGGRVRTLDGHAVPEAYAADLTDVTNRAFLGPLP